LQNSNRPIRSRLDAQTAVTSAINTTAAALAKAANKAITGTVVGAVDANLGLKIDPATEQQIAGAASSSQRTSASQ